MTRARPVVAIDGPVGAGKSTVAREAARALGFSYLYTGAMYRAVAVAAHDAGLAPDSPDLDTRLAPLLAAMAIRFEGDRVFLNGADISARIRELAIGDLASRFSALAPVRERMRDLQRAAGAAGGAVIEGRDIGTVVFPDAEFKFYLDAAVEVRADRRHAELRAQGAHVTRAEVLDQLRERDRRDSSRELAPLKRAPDAIVIDSSHLSIGEVVARITGLVLKGASARSGT